MIRNPPALPCESEVAVLAKEGQHSSLTFRPVELKRDLELIQGWMHEPHVVPFWKLNLPHEAFRRHLEGALLDPHQALYLGLLDGVPMSYWECYWAADDVIGRYYPAHPDDQGVHLLIGPPSYLCKGLALPLLQTVVRGLFLFPGTQRVVAEPDSRNVRMIQVFTRCGFEPAGLIDLPDKRALLMMCDRTRCR
jgi:RimJ/RimL family protein N-acetyltransferase